MMTDGCGGQQKNTVFAAMCMALYQDHPNLESIDHKVFETGHSEMECDSIHSIIEKKSKYGLVYVLQDGHK
jgi:predicted nucleotide-binding protein (sugar kinase/HSP70/actin superfamily)